MDKFQNKYKKKSNRLKEYDYSQHAWYYVTICTKDKFHHFGKIFYAEPRLNSIGKITKKTLLETPKHLQNVEIDEFVIMPNHIHGIIVIYECRDMACHVSTDKKAEFGNQIITNT